MENKNYSINPALNTINIAYSMRAHDLSLSSHRRKQENSHQNYPNQLRLSNISPKNEEEQG
jgi:hypothetical protein